MNLLEHYIIEIHSTERIYNDEKTYVEVDATTDCCGRIDRDTFIVEECDYNKALDNGYFMR